MNTALIPHPRFSTASPIVTAREMILAAACCALEEQKMTLTTEVAALKARNAELTRALLRAHCAGHAIPEVLGLILLAGAGLAVSHWRGQAALACFALGFFLGLAWMILLLLRAKPARTTACRREHPAHMNEPVGDAQIVEAIRGRDVPLGEAYADESEFEPFDTRMKSPSEIEEARRLGKTASFAMQAMMRERPVETLSHPEALTRQLNEAIHSPAAEAARARFEATAQALQTA